MMTMRFEMSFLERAYVANLFRIRASRQRSLADERSMSATRDELIAEADHCEAQAQRLDDAIEPATVSDKEPIRVPSGPGAVDVNYMDKPAQNGTAHP